MSSFKRGLPYIIISAVSIIIIVVAIFAVPAIFNNGATDETPVPPVDNGDSAFIDSLGGVSDTYVGAVSEINYYSAEEAAYAFVENEIVGDSHVHSFTYESVEEFDVDDVDIDIPSEFLYGADSVEKMNVTFNESSAYAYSAMATGETSGSTQRTVTVYVIKYGNNFKYFAPMPITGETITKSYYDSVFNSEKYMNCTMQTSMSAAISASGLIDGVNMSMNMTMSLNQTAKYANDRIYIYQESIATTVMSYGGESETESETSTIYGYLEEDAYGNIVCYVRENENEPWTRGSMISIGFSSMEELVPFYNQYLDYSYFSKTPYGFALEDENARQYFMQAFDELSGSISGVDFGSDGVDMIARYYVQDGALTGAQTDATISAEVSEGGQTANMTVTVDSTMTCTNYGTTVVERPSGID